MCLLTLLTPTSYIDWSQPLCDLLEIVPERELDATGLLITLSVWERSFGRKNGRSTTSHGCEWTHGQISSFTYLLQRGWGNISSPRAPPVPVGASEYTSQNKKTLEWMRVRTEIAQRLRELGIRAGYLRPPDIYDLRAEGLYLVHVFLRFLDCTIYILVN